MDLAPNGSSRYGSPMAQGDQARMLPARVTEVKALSELVLGVKMQAPSDFDWSPGQHLALRSAPDAEELAYYSIASIPNEQEPGAFDLAVSEAAMRVDGLNQPGAQLWIEPAQGGVPAAILGAAHLVLIGMGTGVAPLRALAQAQARKQGRVTLIQGARRFADCLFFDEFQQRRGQLFEYFPVLSGAEESWRGRVGRVQQHLTQVVDLNAGYCVCGSSAMVEEVKRLLLAEGVAEASIFAEGY